MGLNHDNPKLLTGFYKTPLEEYKEFKKEYAVSLCIPSVSSSYSTCVEYMRKYVKNKFQPGFFKAEYIAGRNILKDFLDKSIIDNIRRNKPALAIRPQLDYSFNRENTDLYLYGRNIYNNRTRYKDCFFINPINRNMVSLELEQMRVEFTVRIKVSSYNTGIDLYKFMQMSFRSQATETRFADIDFQIPKSLMLQIARDSKFNIVNNEIEDNCGFLSFINQYSMLPVVCKFRGTKGEYEYFLKIPHMYIHLRCGEIELDEGEREGQTDNNFVASANIECLFPVPKFYAYYSKNKHNFTIESKELECVIYNLYTGVIPYKNSKGWNSYMEIDYTEDNDEFNNNEPCVIKFKEIIDSKSSKTSLYNIAEYTKSINISPNAFMDIKLFNSNDEQAIDIDWNTYTITTRNIMKEQISKLVFYVDLEFINNYAINIEHGYSRRVEDNNNYV